MQIANGMDDPFTASWPKLEYVLKGIKRVQAEKGVASKPRLPVTPGILNKIREVWDARSNDIDVKMLWAAWCLALISLGFFAVGR